MILDRDKDEVNVFITCNDFVVLKSISDILKQKHFHVDDYKTARQINVLYIHNGKISYYKRDNWMFEDDVNIDLDKNPELYDQIIAELQSN